MAIPTTNLPADGRKGPAPKPPAWVELGKPGLAWWKWAWALPQACAWSAGDLVAVAHRASLEDDLDALGQVKGLGVLAALGADEADLVKLVRNLAKLATGRTGLLRQVVELDRQLGLTPKAMSDLRWRIVAPDADTASAQPPVGVPKLDDRRRRLASA